MQFEQQEAFEDFLHNQKCLKNSSEIRKISSENELKCEDAIMEDKKRFGRVRTSMMRHLREEYGKDVANKALARVNKRVSSGSLRIIEQLKEL